MNADVFMGLWTFFGSVFSLFTSWHIPGTRVTPVGWALFCLNAVLCVKLVKGMFGILDYNLHSSSGGSVRGGRLK